MLTTDQKGALAEQAIAFEALTHGVGVSRPLGDERYDLILDLRPQTAPSPMQMGRADEAMSWSMRTSDEEAVVGTELIYRSLRAG